MRFFKRLFIIYHFRFIYNQKGVMFPLLITEKTFLRTGSLFKAEITVVSIKTENTCFYIKNTVFGL